MHEASCGTVYVVSGALVTMLLILSASATSAYNAEASSFHNQLSIRKRHRKLPVGLYGNTSRRRHHGKPSGGNGKGGFLASGLYGSHSDYAGQKQGNENDVDGTAVTATDGTNDSGYLSTNFVPYYGGVLNRFSPERGFPVMCRVKAGQRGVTKGSKSGKSEVRKSTKRSYYGLDIDTGSSDSRLEYYNHDKGKGGKKSKSYRSSKKSKSNSKSKSKSKTKGSKGMSRSGFLSQTLYFRGVGRARNQTPRRRRFVQTVEGGARDNRRYIKEWECTLRSFPPAVPMVHVPSVSVPVPAISTLPTISGAAPSLQSSPTLMPTTTNLTGTTGTTATTALPTVATANTTTNNAPTSLATPAPATTTATGAPTAETATATSLAPTAMKTGAPIASTLAPTTPAPTMATGAPTASTLAPTANTRSPTASTLALTVAPTVTTLPPTMRGLTRTILSYIQYGFFEDNEPNSGPTQEAINGLVNRTADFYSKVFTEEYGTFFDMFELLLTTGSNFTAGESMPFRMDFDAAASFHPNMSEVPSRWDLFLVMNATDYQDYIRNYVWTEQGEYFYDVDAVLFTAMRGQFER